MKNAPRAIRSATISFGLVNIPVKVFSSTIASAKVHFHQLAPGTTHRVKQQLVDSETGKRVERSEIELGYEYAKGRYVTVTEKELEQLEVAASRAMEITDFVPLTSVDPLYFDGASFLGPSEDAARPYALLVRSLVEAELVAVAKVVMRGKEQLVVLRPMEGVLVMHQLHSAAEVRAVADVPVPKASVSAEELTLAKQFIASMAKKRFDIARYEDRYQDTLKSMLKAKVKGKALSFEAPEVSKPEHVDLMAALQASLAKKVPAGTTHSAARGHPRSPHRRTRGATSTRAARARTKR